MLSVLIEMSSIRDFLLFSKFNSGEATTYFASRKALLNQFRREAEKYNPAGIEAAARSDRF